MFVTDEGTHYTVYIDRGFSHESPHSTWSVVFEVTGHAAAVRSKIASGEASPRLRNPFGITGTGDAVRVFSTVVAVLRACVATAHPMRVTFSAHEPSRVRLYRTFMQQRHRYLPGWTALPEKPQHIRGTSAEFTLVAPTA